MNGKVQTYVNTALYIYSEENENLLASLSSFSENINIQSQSLDAFLKNSDSLHNSAEHIVVSAPMAGLKKVILFAVERELSVGVLPLDAQKSLARYFALPAGREEQIELALRKNDQARDLVLCNGELVLYKATIGRMPVIDVDDRLNHWGSFKSAYERFRSLRLLGFTFTTANEKNIDTAACGCMIVQHHAGSMVSRLIANDSNPNDGMISLVVAAPLSIYAYLGFLFHAFRRSVAPKKLPDTLGYIKTSGLTIASDVELAVDIDGETTTSTPVKCELVTNALRLNAGLMEDDATRGETKERIDIKNLPIGSELGKATNKQIPFFSYASEERFKDLFIALRDDARMSSAYVVLMLLSTVLATIGLYQNSTSVVIGAMLLAPLMGPLVSISMGILRGDEHLYRQSANKILIGVALALVAAALITLLFPYKPVTDEMLARLSPSLPDLGVAIFAGIAGAYTKSFKEILQSLAGVAIAVALIPPLAVAGIGLGRGDPGFFGQAFLLFSTNLIGIVAAAIVTFRVLGYSAAIQSKRSMGYVVLALAIISVPLYLTYSNVVEKIQWERSWQNERFLVNGKYVIVKDAEIFLDRDRIVILMDILAREHLDRDDLNVFKQKVQANFSSKLIIRANIIYLL